MRLALALTISLLCAATAYAQEVAGFRLLTLNQWQAKWIGSGDGKPITITYAFVGEATSFEGARNCQSMVPLPTLLKDSSIEQPAFVKEVKAAFAMWEAVANIRFVPADDWRKANIIIGAQAEPQGFAFTDVKPMAAGGPERSIERSLICLNPERRWKIGFNGDLSVLDVRYVIAHEAGHAIGLDHPSRSGQIMSFKYEEHFRSLQAGDKSGAALLYGPRVGVSTAQGETSEAASSLAIVPSAPASR